jgi:hypothetical protein
MENQQPEKPRAVALAVSLLWASIAIGFAKIPLDFQSLAAMPSPGLIWSIVVLVLAFFCFLILKISSGRNWARITYLVLFLIGLIPALPTLTSEFARAPIVAILSIVQAIMQGYAVFLLFTGPGKTWFQKKAPDPAP